MLPGVVLVLVQLVNGQSEDCSFRYEGVGYSLSWSTGIGFVDFFFSYKNFPTRAAYWTGHIQLALIESQYGRVTITSAGLLGSMPPLKLPADNMVTRGYGSINTERLLASFSVPIYYFNECETWTFFINPTQIGMPYLGKMKKTTICNVTNLCTASRTPSSLNVQLPGEVTNLFDQSVNTDFDIKGGLHVEKGRDGATIRFSPNPQGNSYNAVQNFPQQQPFGYNQSPNQLYIQQQQSGPNHQFNGFNQNSCDYPGNYNNRNGYFNNNRNVPNTKGLYDSQFQNTNSQSTGEFAIENPNYKFLPDGVYYQYEQNAGRFYDPNGHPINSQYSESTTTEQPILSNAEQNQLNYQEIQSRGPPQQDSQKFTNNIYGYDYRSNPNSRYTLSGAFDVNVHPSDREQQYQPPQNRRISIKNRRKRQSAYAGTAYQNQDLKFPRVENTIPVAANFDGVTDFDSYSNNNLNPQAAFYNAQNNQYQNPMYNPYRTEIVGDNARFQQLFDEGYGIFGDSSRLSSADNRQFDTNPYSTNNYNWVNRLYNQTQSSLLERFAGGNTPDYLNSNINDNTRSNPTLKHQNNYQHNG